MKRPYGRVRCGDADRRGRRPTGGRPTQSAVPIRRSSARGCDFSARATAGRPYSVFEKLRIRRPSSGSSRLNQISFMDRRDGCDGADSRRAVSQVDPRQRQREEEQQPAGDFIDDGMHSRKLFLFEVPRGDVEQLDDRDDGDPDIKPCRNLQDRDSVVSDSLQPHELQHTRPPCPSPTPGVHPNSCASSW